MESETIGLAWWVFEIVIFGFLIADGIVIAELTARAKKRWHVGRIIAVALLCVAWAVIFYGSFIEPHILLDREVPIALNVDGAPGVARIAVLSDIHVGPYKHERWAQRVVDRINTLDPDLVLIAGDFISRRTEEVEMLRSLKNIEAPVYAVIGNHDHQFADEDAVTAVLEALDVHMLRNETASTIIGEATINIVGIDDWWLEPDVKGAFDRVSTDAVTIAFTHNPDVILGEDGAVFGADLLIAGHTHCGQIRLPFIGPVPPLPTELGRAWDCDLFTARSPTSDATIPLWITRGVGETGPRARLFNPPTIDTLILTW